MAAHEHLNPDEFQSHVDAVKMWQRDQLKSGLDVVSRPGLAVVRLKGGEMSFPSPGPTGQDILPNIPEHGSTVDGMMTGDFRLVNTRTSALDEGGRNHAIKSQRFYTTDDDVDLPRYALTQFIPDTGVLDANPDIPWTMTLHHGKRGSLKRFGNYAGSYNADTASEEEFRDYIGRVTTASGRPDRGDAVPAAVARQRRKSPLFGVVSDHSNSAHRALMVLDQDSGDVMLGDLRGHG